MPGSCVRPSEILERVGERPEPPRIEELAQRGLDARRVPQRLPARAARAQRGSELVRLLVLRDETVDLRVGNGGDPVREHVHAVAVDGHTQPDLRLDLVALGDRDLAHVVAEAGDLQRLRLVPAGGRTGPDAHARRDLRVAPVADDRLPAQAHPRLEEPELTISVCRLVQVHEVHVDLRPRQVAVELRVEMEQRLLQRTQPGDPHLRRREGVHPCDHADARVRRVRVERRSDGSSPGSWRPPVEPRAPEWPAARRGRRRPLARAPRPGAASPARTAPGSRSRARPRGVRACQAPSLETSSIWLRKLEIISSVSFSSDVSCTVWSSVMRPPCITLMRSHSSKRWA